MHWSGEVILLVFIAAVTAVMLLLLHLTKLGHFIRQTIPDRPHRRMFLASISFFITFLAVRLLVASIQHHIGPFQYVTMGGRHIHHLVWGILILLGVGYGYLNEVGSGATPVSLFASRLMSILYGVGAALTLDEFALWLNLANVYWSREGRESIDAVVLFGSLLAIGTWGAPLYTAILRKK
jgi:hypothetical protein